VIERRKDLDRRLAVVTRAQESFRREMKAAVYRLEVVDTETVLKACIAQAVKDTEGPGVIELSGRAK